MLIYGQICYAHCYVKIAAESEYTPSMVIRYSLGSDKRLLEKLPLDPARSDMLVSKTKSCMWKYMPC